MLLVVTDGLETLDTAVVAACDIPSPEAVDHTSVAVGMLSSFRCQLFMGERPPS